MLPSTPPASAQKIFWLRLIGTGAFCSKLGGPMPGTMGSLTATLIFGGLWYGQAMNLWLLAALIAASFWLSVWAGNHAPLAFDGRQDPGEFVMDEFCGQWIALLPLTWHASSSIWQMLGAFVLFRFFDMLKPGPVAWMEKRLSGGWGVTMDDVVAGMLAAGVMEGLILWLWGASA